MFSKKERIPREIVKKVMSEGQKGYSELFLFKKLNNNLDFNRYTIVVSKKVSKTAVGRNEVRRKIKSALKESLKEVREKQKQTMKSGSQKFLDVVIILSPIAKDASYKKILNEIKTKKVLS